MFCAAFYRFTPLPDPAALAGPLRAGLAAAGVRGTVLLATEGVNGALAGSAEALAAATDALRDLPGCGDLAPRLSPSEDMPFGRLKVKVKAEIVTMGVPGVDPARRAGTRVAPADWNALIAAPDVAVIDTRNAYEVALGSFAGAIDPGTDSFRDFPGWWADQRAALAGKRIAMFCTGGIRCEKATNYLLSQGLDEVFHLEGGVLAYLEQIPAEASLWRGECFVFDGRVGLTAGLATGEAVLCAACGRPATPEDRARPEWEEGVSCQRCIDEHDAAARERFRRRAAPSLGVPGR